MLNLKFNPETKTLIADEKVLAELIKSVRDTNGYKFVPGGSDDEFIFTITLPICCESSQEDKESFINFLVGLISTNPEYSDQHPQSVKEKLQKLWLESS